MIVENGVETPQYIPMSIGDKCATFMYANGQNFIVCGGNDDFKEFYDYCYNFDCDMPSSVITAMPPLPVKMY
jgi:hypothetical protein